MKNPRLHFSNRQQADRPLRTGVHRIARHADGAVAVDDTRTGALLAQFCVDRRGLWLQVADPLCGVHINGRPVRRMALLRVGDAVYVDGVEILIQAPGEAPSPLPAPVDAPLAPDPRVVLRGVGGQHHGRCFSLDAPKSLGSAADADIRLDSSAVAPRHARLERHGERVLLRSLDPSLDSVVNGMRMRDAWLSGGDQLVLGAQHRFVVEVPAQEAIAADDDAVAEHAQDALRAAPEVSPQPSVKRWPWLLLAALLLAAAINALLWYGVG